MFFVNYIFVVIKWYLIFVFWLYIIYVVVVFLKMQRYNNFFINQLKNINFLITTFGFDLFKGDKPLELYFYSSSNYFFYYLSKFLDFILKILKFMLKYVFRFLNWHLRLVTHIARVLFILANVVLPKLWKKRKDKFK